MEKEPGIPQKVVNTSGPFLLQDSLKLLEDWKIDYGFNKEPGSKEISVKLHGLKKFKGYTNTTHDEYYCTYVFVSNKLDLIKINYFRDFLQQLENILF